MTGSVKRVLALLVVATMLPLACSCSVKKQAQPGPQSSVIQQAKILEYLKEAETHPTYPDSMSLAYASAYSLTTLKGMSPETKAKLIAYVKGSQMSDGGFSDGPQSKSAGTVLSTYFALETLRALGAVDSIDKEKATAFILSLVQADGGIKAAANDPFESIVTTYYGIRALDALGTLDRLDKPKAAAYVLRYKEKGQGFSIQPGGISVPQATAMGGGSLALLGGLSPEVQADVVSFLKGTRYSGLTDRKYSTQPTVKEEAFVLEALSDLGSIDVVDKSKILGFLESLYIAENGGFGSEPTMGASPQSTFEAIVALRALGELN